MRHAVDHAGTRNRRLTAKALIGLALAIGAMSPATAEDVAGFKLRSGPPWDCPPQLQNNGNAINCVAVIVINKDGTFATCPCNLHGAGHSTQSTEGWTVKIDSTVVIQKLVPPNYGGTDPCVTYTIGGVPQKICW